MKLHCTHLVRFLSLATVILMLAAGASAQQPIPASKPGDFKIVGIKQYLRQAPRYSGSGSDDLGGQIPAASKPWLRIEVEFRSEPAWADDVQIKYYVMLGKGKEMKMFTGEVVHMTVPAGRHYSAMLMHPYTIERYGQGKVEAVAVQLYHQNRLMDQDGDPKTRTRWWEQFSPTPGYLMSPLLTPWSVLAHQRYIPERVVTPGR